MEHFLFYLIKYTVFVDINIWVTRNNSLIRKINVTNYFIIVILFTGMKWCARIHRGSS